MRVFTGSAKEKLYIPGRRARVGWIIYGPEKVVAVDVRFMRMYGFDSQQELESWLTTANYERRKEKRYRRR